MPDEGTRRRGQFPAGQRLAAQSRGARGGGGACSMSATSSCSEITPCHGGQFAQICRTTVIGEADAAIHGKYPLLQSAMRRGQEAAVPGARRRRRDAGHGRLLPRRGVRGLLPAALYARARPRARRHLGPAGRFDIRQRRAAGGGHGLRHAPEPVSAGDRLHDVRRAGRRHAARCRGAVAAPRPRSTSSRSDAMRTVHPAIVIGAYTCERTGCRATSFKFGAPRSTADGCAGLDGDAGHGDAREHSARSPISPTSFRACAGRWRWCRGRASRGSSCR